MDKEYELSIAKLLEISGLPDLHGQQSHDTFVGGIAREGRASGLIVMDRQCGCIDEPAEIFAKRIKPFEQHYRKLIMRCMFGIINAARNSGVAGILTASGGNDIS